MGFSLYEDFRMEPPGVVPIRIKRMDLWSLGYDFLPIGPRCVLWKLSGYFSP